MNWFVCCYRKYNNVILTFFIATLLVLSIPCHAIPSQKTSASQKPKVILLVHGLMRTSTSMFFLKHYLKKQGYDVYCYNYPSARRSLHEHGLYLKDFVQELIQQHPEQSVYLVTHSMGGIIAREALALLPARQIKHIEGLVMLAPPNQGSSLAQFTLSAIPGLSYFIKPLPELSTKNRTYLHQIPIPKVNIGIIAGRYDAKVPPKSAYLQGQNPPVLVNSTHTFIMNNPQVRVLIKRFVEKGNF